MGPIGKYEILERIGSGGFATVYKGWDPFIKRWVAIKICYSRDEETRQRFFREAEIAGQLVHRNITTIYDFGMQEQNPYLVEEYLPGEDLAQQIRRQEPKSLPTKLDYLLQIASGLEYAHSRSVIHRDIKPSNVRVLENGELKIMDFGTAKLAHAESHLTQSGMTLGTVAYLPPERLLGRPSGLNSDLFSYGVLAYELLSFRRPFSGRNIPHLIDQVLNAAPIRLSEVWPESPNRLTEIVHRCLLKDPQERYATCSDLIVDLQEVAAEISGPKTTFSDLPTAVTSVTNVAGAVSSVSGIGVSAAGAGGLLERARQLFAQGKYQRAEVIIEEILELEPQNVEAQQLLVSCRQRVNSDNLNAPASGESTSRNAAETPDQRRARKISEAVQSIETYVRSGQFAKAAEALAFANRFFGSAFDALLLKRRIIAAARDQLIGSKSEALRIGRHIVDQMILLRQKERLHSEVAELLAGMVREFDPENFAATDLLALSRQQILPSQPTISDRDRRRLEAIQSIESFLAQGNAAMADEALRFAIRLLGEFDQAGPLRQRIGEALRAQA